MPVQPGTVFGPAIEYPTEGYPVSEIVASQWKDAADLFSDENAREAYLPNGHEPSVGETVTLEALGESLRAVADRGADIVYEGEIAGQTAAEVQSHGGFLTVEDLSDFEPTFVDPVKTIYRDATVYELPPNNQGRIALEALNVAKALDAGDHLRLGGPTALLRRGDEDGLPRRPPLHN